ncbi:MAG: LysR family transcriptional regulator [Anaerolineae bacterium]|nr:LysR family transcriptional regulator [Anaerolineae bacterium]
MTTAISPHANLWVERDGRVVLSLWRVQLLEAIEATGSINAAAERMQVQYHRAWDRLQEMEQGLGVPLIERHVGGQGGGGARLTEAGRQYVACFNVFARSVEGLISEQFNQAFPDELAAP